MIRLEVGENEFCLYVPIAEKERAKAIEGRRWDPDRKCWTYAKTRRIYDAIIAEFGDELGNRPTPRTTGGGAPEARPLQSSVSDENIRLRAELKAATAEVDALRASLARTSELQRSAIDGQIAPYIAALEREQKVSSGLRNEVSEAVRTRDAATAELERMRRERVRQPHIIEQLATERDDKKRFVLFLKALALQASGNDRELSMLLDQFQSPELFPAIVRRELELKLRTGLSMAEKPLVELINLAKESDMLSPEAAGLAHTIRHEGNRAAHGTVDPQTVWARCLITLYAASLVWPEFSR